MRANSEVCSSRHTLGGRVRQARLPSCRSPVASPEPCMSRSRAGPRRGQRLGRECCSSGAGNLATRENAMPCGHARSLSQRARRVTDLPQVHRPPSAPARSPIEFRRLPVPQFTGTSSSSPRDRRPWRSDGIPSWSRSISSRGAEAATALQRSAALVARHGSARSPGLHATPAFAPVLGVPSSADRRPRESATTPAELEFL